VVRCVLRVRKECRDLTLQAARLEAAQNEIRAAFSYSPVRTVVQRVRMIPASDRDRLRSSSDCRARQHQL
jgi:hypothetical protein